MSAAEFLTVNRVVSDPRGSSAGRRVHWQVAHAKLVGLAKSRAGLDWEEGRWLVLAERSQVHARLGLGSFAEYVERLFGYGPRFVREKLRVAETLEGLPALTAKLQSGEITWTATRELTRVAVAKTEADWLAAAEGKTAREVERMVSGHVPGDRPSDLPHEAARRHVLRFEVSGDVLATFREAIAKLRRESGEPLDDEAILLLMARQVLGGPTDSGRASYQLAMSVCPSCRRGNQQGAGETVVLDDEIVAMAKCDAQHLHEGEKATQTVPPATRRAVLHRDSGRCVFPGCRHGTFVDVHHTIPKAEGGDHDPEKLITVCSAHHRAIHRGKVLVDGTPSTGLRFWHADGSAYGSPASPPKIDARAKAFQALRNLGFSERAARQALEQVTHGSHADIDESVEQLVRACLVLLTERHAASHAGQR